MALADIGLGIFITITVLLIALLVRQPQILRGTGGRAVAVVAFCALPVTVTSFGLVSHLERAKTTEFCLSCHVMEPYGQSLYIDDGDYLAAGHFQNRRIPKETACYTCHTTYTMFGDLQAKLAGLQHLWVYYSGQTPEHLELYRPFQNRECLSCHGEARSYLDNELHLEVLDELTSNDTSCLECHEFVHGVDELEDLPMWTPTNPGEE